MNRVWAVAWIALVCAASCKDNTADRAPSERAVSGAPTTPAEATKAMSVPHNVVPRDVAYLGVEGAGLVRVANGKASTVVAHDYPMRSMAIDSNGVVYATAIGGAWRVEGDKVTALPEIRAYGTYPDHVAIGADGVLWAIDYEGAYRFDGTAWTHFTKATFADVDLLKDIEVDHEKRVWIATPDDLWRHDGAAWMKVDKAFAKTRTPYFAAVAAGPDTVYASGGLGVFAYAGDTWTKVPARGRSGDLDPDELAVGPDGRVAMSGGVSDVVIVPPGGTPMRVDLAKIGRARSTLTSPPSTDLAARGSAPIMAS